MHLPVPRLVLLCVVAASIGSMARAQTFIDVLNGTSPGSTFNTPADGFNPVGFVGWMAVSGGAQVFGQSTNDVLIGTDPFANYEVQFNTTATTLLPNSTYTLSVRVGFVSTLGADATASYALQLGTTTGSTNFTALTADIPALTSGTITRTAPSNTVGNSFGTDVAFSDTITVDYTTGPTVSGDRISVRLAQIGSSNTGGADYFGFDNATLSVAPSAIPEPSTYAALFGAGVLGFAAWKRRPRAQAGSAKG